MSGASRTYSIHALVKATGISAESLRNWEKRYAIFRPQRSPSGQRFYSADDLETVRKIARLLKTGARIGDLCRTLAAGDPLPTLAEDARETATEAHVTQLVAALKGWDTDKANFLTSTLALSLSPEDMVMSVYAPILNWKDDKWDKKQLNLAQERFMVAFIRHRLYALATLAPSRSSKLKFVLASLGGETHETEILILNCLLRLRGHTTIYLGCDFPFKALSSVDQSLTSVNIYLTFASQKMSEKKLSRFKGFNNRIIIGSPAQDVAEEVLPGVFAVRAGCEDLVVRLEDWAGQTVRSDPRERN